MTTQPSPSDPSTDPDAVPVEAPKPPDTEPDGLPEQAPDPAPSVDG